ncbi:MAG: PQQ-like beta-propeller repeat protein [Planctomycetales bacterium]|nr:PQQ-like beta-propeller repeat protein [Planctomycetales bacterium]
MVCQFLFALSARAEDWPQWMGPSRDNRWQAPNTVVKFPSGGPKILWRSPVKIGYSGPAVVADRLYLTEFETDADVKVSNFDRKAFRGIERIKCISSDNGQEIWSHEYPVEYSCSYPSGPRCTPIVDGNQVYVLGGEGNLISFDRNNGQLNWQRDLKSDYKTTTPLWGFASHPLIDGERLICLAGGPGSHVVALNKKTGQEIWRHGTASEQGYSPALLVTAGGVRQLIVSSPDYVASLNPETGSEFWRQEYGASNGAMIMTPVQSGNFLFVGGFSNRNLMLELDNSRPKATQLFRDKPKLGMSPVNVQPFVEGDLMIGMDQSGELIAAEIPSGTRLWTSGQPLGERPVNNGTAFLVKNGEHFYMFTEQGELVIAQVNRNGYQEVDRAKVIEPTNNAFGRPVVWSAPAFANGRMYVRNDNECVCVELTAGR